ncbi:MAG TPA: TetR family transcriptional regulator [Candidatus Limnocylindrales bacterium]
MQASDSPHRALSTDAVVDAALEIADAGGLDAVSLRRLASTFGVTPMALYRHVRDKDHLLDLMAGRVLDELDVETERGSTWQEDLRRLGNSFLALVAAHPAAPFLLSRPFESPGSRRVSVALLGILARAGFDPRDAVPLLQALTGMLLGPAVHRATYAAAAARTSSREPSEPPGSAAAAGGETDWPVDQLTAWAADPDADRLVVELWVAGVQGLAASRLRSGGRDA